MKTELKVEYGVVNIRHVLEPNEIKALKEMKEKGYLEYRTEYSSDKEMYYSGRNTEILYDSITDLIRNKFIKYDDDAWHTALILTRLGKDVVEKL